MINFSVLGEVRADDGPWQAALQRQQQLLLANLVMEEGKPVPRAGLLRLLWGEDDDPPPKENLRRAVSELRTALKPEDGAPDLVPFRGDTYRLVMEAEQADVLRFRAKVKQAGRADGPESARLMKAALEEWPEAAGLFGGHPLRGLRGRWAEWAQETLRAEYRNARFHCLWQDLTEHRYRELAAECRALADDPDALRDEEFVELWMVATYHAGQRTAADGIYRRARDAADEPLSGRVGRLAELIRTEDPELGDPGEWFAADLVQLRSITLHPVPARGRPMSDSDLTFAADESQPAWPHEAPGQQADDADQQDTAAPGVTNTFHGPVDARKAVFGNQIINGRPR